MKFPPTSVFAAAGLCLAVLALTGCTKKSREASHVRKADEYFEADKYGAAEIEYINALRIDPQDPHALGRLGIIYLNQGRPQAAFSLLSEATQLKPDFLEVRDKMAQLEIQFGKFKEAKENLDYVLAHDPLDAEAPPLLVDTARTRAAVEEVRKSLLALPSPAPDRAPVLVALGLVDLHEHKFDDAASALTRAEAADAKSGDARTGFAYLYRAQNERAKAESAFAEAASLSGAHSPKQLQYAEYELRIGNVDQAKKILDAITLKAPDYVPAWILLAQIASEKKNYDDGLADIAKVLAIDPANPAALMENSHLQLAKGDATGAVTNLESASKNYPKSAKIDFELAKAYLAEGNNEKAEMSLKRVLAREPNVTEAQMMLAGIEVKKGDVPAAVTILRKVIHDHPESVQARMLLGESLRATGALDEAIALFQQLAEAQPKNVEPHMMLGAIFLQKNQPEASRAAFTKARAIDPDYLPALERLVDFDLGAKNFEGAHRQLNEQIGRHPKDGVVQLILARTYLAQRDAAGAEAALKRAIEFLPDDTRAYSLLAELYLSTNRQDDALADLRAAVAKNPKNVEALRLLAVIQERLKDYAGARTSYETILSVLPNSIAVINNLAYLYSERLNDTDKALELAEKAQRLLPDEPHIADTLGWILYRQHKYTRAFGLLSESAEKLPKEADLQFHLGMAAYMLGREAAARASLQHALDLSSDFMGRDDAVRHVKLLAEDTSGFGEADRAALEKEALDEKDDPVILNRLAGLYERLGSVDKAIAACEDALKTSPDDALVISHLARLYLAKNDTAKAIELGKKARQLAPDDAQLAHVLASAAYQAGDFHWSLSLLQEAAGKLPDDPEVHFDLGMALYSEGNVADAEAQMKAALQAGPAFKRSAAAKQFIEWVDFSNDPSRAVAARAAIQQAADAHPTDAAAQMALAAVDEGAGDAAAAKKIYVEVLHLLPDFSPAKRNLAIIYSKSAEDDKTAFDLAVKARTAFPDDPALAQALGTLDYRRGDYFNAKNLLTDASVQRTDDPDLNFYLGMTKLNLKDPAGARKALQRALDLKVEPSRATEARQALDKIK